MPNLTPSIPATIRDLPVTVGETKQVRIMGFTAAPSPLTIVLGYGPVDPVRVVEEPHWLRLRPRAGAGVVDAHQVVSRRAEGFVGGAVEGLLTIEFGGEPVRVPTDLTELSNWYRNVRHLTLYSPAEEGPAHRFDLVSWRFEYGGAQATGLTASFTQVAVIKAPQVDLGSGRHGYVRFRNGDAIWSSKLSLVGDSKYEEFDCLVAPDTAYRYRRDGRRQVQGCVHAAGPRDIIEFVPGDYELSQAAFGELPQALPH